MKQFTKIEVDGDTIFLHKATSPVFKGWHVVYPVKNENGTINWKHLITGRSWWNLIFVLIFILVFIGFAIEYNANFKSCKLAMEEINVYKVKYETKMPDLAPEVANQLRLPKVDNVTKQIPNFTLGVTY